MSSPRNIGGSVREGTRVVLKEITASLQNSTLNHLSRQKSGGIENPVPKTTAEHEVKVRFAREFVDVESVARSGQESLSSTSSFHSLDSNTLSTRSSSGICPDSPEDLSNISYVNTDIPGVEDLILACSEIHLGNDRSFNNAFDNIQDLSQDQTFASAIDESLHHTSDCSLNEDLRPDSILVNETQVIVETSSQSQETTLLNTSEPFNNTILIYDTQSVISCSPTEETYVSPEKLIENLVLLDKSDNTTNEFEACSNANKIVNYPSNVNDNQLDITIVLPDNSIVSEIAINEEQEIKNSHSAEILSNNLQLCSAEVSVPSASDPQYTEIFPLPCVSDVLLLEDTDNKSPENSAHDLSEPTNDSSTLPSSEDIDQKVLVSSPTINNFQTERNEITRQDDLSYLDNCAASVVSKENSTQLNETNVIETNTNSETRENLKENVDTQQNLVKENSATLNETQILSPEKDVAISNETCVTEEQHNPSETVIIKKEKDIADSAASTSTVNETESSLEDLDRTLPLQEIDIDFAALDENLYSEFKPQRQSTTISLNEKQPDLDELRSSAKEITDDLLESLPVEESDHFISATSEIFQDPSTFDFLLARSNSRHTNRLRTESLYIKFDPLVSNISMLPQGNIQPINEEQNGKNESPLPNVGTPKRNPAIAAIDRLLFYSPLSSGTVQKSEETQEKNEQPVEEPKSDAPLIDDIDMTKELELVRAAVLQLEEELEKQKKEHEAELERQKATFQEKINKVQTQMAQEVKTKSQMTVVVEEYEKSISRLLTERERDRTNLEQEKAKLQEELQAANHHLTNTEAAFNDVHQKYERLKGVVSVYKNNETVLKESIQENVDTIKTLETRYDQLKDHAMAQLEKANLELDTIRKQNEAETVKLHAMIRKAELKSNSLAELVEQKIKENKELTKILDEVIARVGHGNPE